jgi:hypothetical protein
MADAPDITHGGRYPSMAGQAPEVERPADPKDAGRYWSMPGGAIPDRRVPRHPAEPAAPVGELAIPDAGDDRALRGRYPSMYPDAPAPAAPAAEGEAGTPAEAAPGTELSKPEAPAELPVAYRDLQAPEDLEINPTVFAAVAPDLQKLNLDRSQVEGLLKVYAGLQQREDAAVTAVQAAWRQEAAALPAATLADARSALKDAPAELLRMIEVSRIGDHPAVIAFFARLRSGGAAPADAAELAPRRRFPNTKWN